MADTIMIVEDEKSQARAMQLILEREGYRTILVSSVKACLKKLETERPELILSDIVMTGEFGTALLVELKKDPALKDIPVVVTTIVSPLSGIKEDVEKIYPGVGFLEKPFSRDELLEKVRHYLGK